MLHKKAYLLLQRMVKLSEQCSDVTPTTFTYNAVLNACAESREKEAFGTAVRVFQELRKAVTLDHVTYGNLLRCASHLEDGSDKHEQFVSATFQLCCDKGLVNNFVLRDLEMATTEKLWGSLVGFEGMVDANQLPDDWTWKARQSEKKKSHRGGTGGRGYGSSHRGDRGRNSPRRRF